jgi:transposase InsO family protein
LNALMRLTTDLSVPIPRRFNMAPTQTAPIVRATPDGGRELVTMRWGLVPSWAPRERHPMTPITGVNESWSMDFVSDRLGDGRQFRTLTVVGDFLKRCPVLEVDTSISGERVTRALDRGIDIYGKPRRLVMDNGPEFTSRALLEWAGKRDIELVWIEPGKPIQNAFAESFNARFRDECLDQHHFTTLGEARSLIELWRQDYNHLRPHAVARGARIRAFGEAKTATGWALDLLMGMGVWGGVRSR